MVDEQAFTALPPSQQPVLLYQFNLPTTKKIDFSKYIRTDDAKTADNLKQLTSCRNELIKAISDPDVPAKGVITACDSYIPFMYGLVVSVENDQKIRLTKPLGFSWSSALQKDGKRVFSQIYTYKYEATMVIALYAFAHLNYASQVLMGAELDDWDDTCKMASGLLRTAAGIFKFLETRELPRWTDMPSDRPTEISPAVCKAFSEYCTAGAQALTVKKALIGGSTSKPTMAKLAYGVYQKYLNFQNSLKSQPEFKDKIQVIFKSFLDLQLGLAKATAYKYQGEAYYDIDQLGTAIAYLIVGVNALKGVWTPGEGTKLSLYAKEIALAKEDIEHVLRSYSNENDHIQFKKVPPEGALEQIEAKELMTPLNWTPSKPAFTKLR